jgi:hypothetical protein
MHGKKLEALRERLERARDCRRPPYRCPIKAMISPEMRCQTVPRRLRMLAAVISHERVVASKLSGYGPSYYQVSSIVEGYYGWLLDQLRKEFRLSDTTMVEFGRRWTHGTVTVEELQAAYDLLPKTKQNTEGEATGPTLAFRDNQPPERWSQPEYIFGRQLRESSLERYLKTCREENKKGRGQ